MVVGASLKLVFKDRITANELSYKPKSHDKGHIKAILKPRMIIFEILYKRDRHTKQWSKKGKYIYSNMFRLNFEKNLKTLNY